MEKEELEKCLAEAIEYLEAGDFFSFPLDVSGADANANPDVPQSALYKIDGMTMQAPNPEYEQNKHAYEDLLLQSRILHKQQEALRRDENMLADDANAFYLLRSQYGRSFPHVFVSNGQFASPLNAAAVNESLIEKPYRVQTAINKDYQQKLAETFDQEYQHVLETKAFLVIGKYTFNVSKSEIEDAARAQNPDVPNNELPRRIDLLATALNGIIGNAENVRSVARQIAYDTFARFSQSIEQQDFSALPLTLELLDVIFTEFLNSQYSVRKRRLDKNELLDFDVDDQTYETENQEYYRNQVYALPVAQMLNWFEEWKQDLPEQFNQDIVTAIGNSVITLVTGRVPERDDQEPTYEALARGKNLLTFDRVIHKINSVIENILYIHLALEGFPRNAEYAQLREKELFSTIEKVTKRLDTEEFDRQTQFIGIWNRAFNAHTELQISAHALQEKTKRISPTISRNLIVERNIGQRNPIVLRARVVYDDEHERDAPSADYTFTWLHTAFDSGGGGGGGGGERIIAFRETRNNYDSYTLADSNYRYETGLVSGTYRVVVTRNGEERIDSVVGKVRIFGVCVRDGHTVELGVRRTFGECSWKTKPINADRTNFRRKISSLAGQLQITLGVGDSLDYQPVFDDVLRDPSHRVIMDDESLLNVATFSSVRDRYFTLTSVLYRLDNLLSGNALSLLYNNECANDLFAAFRSRNSIPLLGALSFGLYPASQSEIQQYPSIANNKCRTLFDQQIDTQYPHASMRSIQGISIYPALQLLMRAPQTHVLRQLLGMSDTRLIQTMLGKLEYIAITFPHINLQRATTIQICRDTRDADYFFDKHGYQRFVSRVTAARARTSSKTRAVRSYPYLNEREHHFSEITLKKAFGSPLGLPLRVWYGDTDLCSQQVENADWTGVHSITNNQPDVYSVQILPHTATLSRGSERLYSGYEFRQLHNRIKQLVDTYNDSNSGSQKRDIKIQIEKLVRAFNAFSQFAQPLEIGITISAREIESRARQIVV